MEYLRSRMQNVCALIAATEAVNEFVRPEAAVNVAMAGPAFDASLENQDIAVICDNPDLFNQVMAEAIEEKKQFPVQVKLQFGRCLNFLVRLY